MMKKIVPIRIGFIRPFNFGAIVVPRLIGLARRNVPKEDTMNAKIALGPT